LNLGYYVGFCFLFLVFFGAVLFCFMHPLWWDNYRTKSAARSPGLKTETDTKIIKTETSLHLNLEVLVFLNFFIIYYSFCFILFLYIYFFHLLIFYFYSYLYSFYFQSSLCLMPVQLTVD
jgi:hypothetical protein